MPWSRAWAAGVLCLSWFSLSCAPLGLSSPPFLRAGAAHRPPGARVHRLAPRPDQAVRQVQGLLYERGYDVGPIDGLIGPQTQRTLRAFQQDHKLPKTGQVDAATKAALLQTPTPE